MEKDGGGRRDRRTREEHVEMTIPEGHVGKTFPSEKREREGKNVEERTKKEHMYNKSA